MIKGILKLALLALLANATWHVFVPYRAFLKFKDALQAAELADVDRSDDERRSRVMSLASQFDIPLMADGFTLEREGNHTITDGSYSQPMELFPTFFFPWTFTWHTDTMHFAPIQGGPSSDPK